MTCPEAMGVGLKEGEKPSHAGKAPYPVLYLLLDLQIMVLSGDAIPVWSATRKSARLRW